MSPTPLQPFATPASTPLPARGPTPAWIGSLAEALRGARAPLARRGAADVARSLGRVGERFLDTRDPLRAEALELLPSAAALSTEMAAAVLDGMAAGWTTDELLRLLDVELGGPDVLDGFVQQGARRSLAVGPVLCVQVVAGSVPGVGVSALARSLLVKGPTLLKPGRGDTVLPVLFARALRETDAELADALAVVYWPGGNEPLDAAALARADVVTCYGSDKTVRVLRAQTAATSRFVAYHHRVSVGVVGREALGARGVGRTAADVARAVALFDQRGCVSPQVVFVEEGGEVGPEGFADALADALAEIERRLPTASLGTSEASSLQQARGTAELLEASGSVRVRHGGAAAWTVVLEEGAAGERAGGAVGVADEGAPRAWGAGAGRFVRLRRVAGVERVPALLEPLGPHLQTVGVAGLGARVEELAIALGRAGASRVVSFGAVPFPPPSWHHDGGGPLRDLVRWIDLEQD